MGRNGSTCLPPKTGNDWTERHWHPNGPQTSLNLLGGKAVASEVSVLYSVWCSL